MLKRLLLTVFAPLFASHCSHAADTAAPAGYDAGAAIARFAADYASDPYLDRETEFGVEVGGSWWTVRAAPSTKSSVTPGRPGRPTFYFTMDRDTLERLDSGRMNALTAMVRAKQDDPTPMDIDTMEGFQPDKGFLGWAIPLVFHFWTRGEPQVIPFRSDSTRLAHGAQMSVFYYQPGFRSAFVEIRPGQHANEQAGEDQEDPFPNMLIITRGRVHARIGGKELVLKEGEAVYLRENVPHEFWNPFDVAAQGIWLAFGEGA